MDGVDLQQAHAFDRRHHIAAPWSPPQGLQQALGGQLQQACLRQAQDVTIT
jgi:hypothetical protein